LKIALQTRAGLYDVFFALLAQQEQCGLVTAEQRMINNLPSTFLFICSRSVDPVVAGSSPFVLASPRAINPAAIHRPRRRM
jgi:hypothetical protein